MKMKILGLLICFIMLTTLSLSAASTTEETTSAPMQAVTITRPIPGNLYFRDTYTIPIIRIAPIIIGPITLEATAEANVTAVNWTVLDKNGNAWHTNVLPPGQPPDFQLYYNTKHTLIKILIAGGPQATIIATALNSAGNPIGSDSLNVTKFF
jgi:hypothetical protein